MRGVVWECACGTGDWIVVTKRPKWIDEPKRISKEEKKREEPRRNYAFGVWDWQHEGPPIIVRVR